MTLARAGVTHGASEQRVAAWVASLRSFLETDRPVAEHCELCNTEIAHEHPHLIAPDTRRLLCACQACALLFDGPEAKRYRRVPRSVTELRDFKLSDSQWDALLIPINIAFFFYSSPLGRVVAMYPGPAGATESTLSLSAWSDLVETNPLLKELEQDVEALLINRMGGTQAHYRVPIDRCYELVGLIRSHWHGLSGGEGVQQVLHTFYERLREEMPAGGANRSAAHA